MSLSRTLLVGGVLGVLMFCHGSSARTFAQTNKPADSVQNEHEQTLKQLLVEIRELRLAVQRATVSHTRFQMLIERVRIQQGQVDAVARQLENLRSQATELRTTKPHFEQQLKESEELLGRTTDANERNDLESRIKSIKFSVARFAPEEERLRSREATLEAELQTLQAKLNELNSQLDALMNDMKTP